MAEILTPEEIQEIKDLKKQDISVAALYTILHKHDDFLIKLIHMLHELELIHSDIDTKSTDEFNIAINIEECINLMEREIGRRLSKIIP